MAQVINLQEKQYSRVKLVSQPPKVDSSPAGAEALPGVSLRSPGKEEVFRALLLLDVAAQHARLIVRTISDPARREMCEAQTATIEGLLQIARYQALEL